MNYFLIGGRAPLLSLLEIHALLPRVPGAASIKTIGCEAVIISGNENVRIPELVHTLGGVIKGGVLLPVFSKNFDDAATIITNDLLQRSESAKGRITFGISVYSVSQKQLKENVAQHIQRLGITIKKEIRDGGASLRFVSPQHRERSLSSVVVQKNHLAIHPHAEYVLLIRDSSIDIGITAAVQEFEEYSYRDYQRPHRDMKTGLLPPKLARMMINLAGIEPKNSPVILDPFCGLGTILQEAFLLGYTNVWGSDIDKKNIRAAKENIEWVNQNFRLDSPRRSRAGSLRGNNSKSSVIVKQCDARKLFSCFPKHSVDAVVTEPTLGPALNRRRPCVSRAEINALCDLYASTFQALRSVLKKDGRVIIVFPVWIQGTTHTFIPCFNEIVRMGFTNITIPAELTPLACDVTKRNSILLSRPDARVAREFFIFQKVKY